MTTDARREAYENARLTLNERQQKVLKLIVAAGEDGLTVSELMARLFTKSRNSVAPRCTELKDAGKIRKSGTRRGPFGANESVWVAVKDEPQGRLF